MYCLWASLSGAQLFANPWTAAHQTPLSGISQARILEWVAISFSRDLPNEGMEPETPALEGSFFTTEPSGKPSEDRVRV